MKRMFLTKEIVRDPAALTALTDCPDFQIMRSKAKRMERLAILAWDGHGALPQFYLVPTVDGLKIEDKAPRIGHYWDSDGVLH